MTTKSPNVLMACAMMAILQESESLEARVDAVRNAVWKRNERRRELSPESAADWFMVDVYQDRAIVRQGNQLMQVTYTIADTGAIEFGEPEPVAVEYRPLNIELLAESVAATAPTTGGYEWDVCIIKKGHSKNGYYYSAEALKEAVDRGLFENRHVYFFDDPKGHKENPLEKMPRNIAGWIDTVRLSESGDVVGRLHFLQESSVDHVRRQIHDAWTRGNTKLFGLSIDARGQARAPALIEGKMARFVESLALVLSTDIVLHPAAGGGFTRLVESTDTASKEGSMKLKEQLLKLLETRRPTVFGGIDQESITVERLAELCGDELIQEAFATTPAAPGGGTPTPQPADAANVLQETQRMFTRSLVREKLQASKLPEPVQKRLRGQLDGQILQEAEIDAAIQAERDYLASLHPARVSGLGGARDVRVGAEKLDRLQAAFDRACGIEPTNTELRTIKPLGLRGLYNEITMGHDAEVNGVLTESAMQEMLQEAFDSTTLARVVANTLNRRLARDYAQQDYAERRIITIRPGVTDFKTQEVVRVGYFGDLGTVDPESGDYAELAAYGEESATYAVGQKGNIVTITRKHIKNDDVGHVAKVVGRLGRAARRTFANFVWSFAVTNPVIYTTRAWFHATDANLITTALSVAGLNAAELAMFNQTEVSSGKKLGLKPKTLVVPIELKATAIGINQSPFLPGSANNDANPWYHAFGANNENIVVSPLFTDANDWVVFADPDEADIIEVAFMDGNEEPELFLADVPTIGQMFAADKLQYKIRHEYGGAVVDFRSAVKSVVA